MHHEVVEQLIRMASEQRLTPSAFEAATLDLGASRDEICDAFSKRVAQAYLRGEYSFTFADAAMNALFAFACPVERVVGLPSLAWQVYDAFDQGEYVRVGEPEELHGEVRTKGLLFHISDLADV